MFRRHVTRQLSAYLHGELTPEENERVKAHLLECERCRDSHDELRFGMQLVSKLSKTTAPESLWQKVQTGNARPMRAAWIPRIAAAGAVAVLCVAVVFVYTNRKPAPAPNGPSWVVENLGGTPRIENSEVHQQGKLQPGETLHTDAASKAQVNIADIGRLFVEPETRLKLIVTKSNEHRVSLDQGKVEALTWAPPRLFIVDTPSATAVDLGCRYTLEVQKDGSSLLHVTLGMVSLENNGRATFVPANFFARTRTGAGPGTPFHGDSSEDFKAALDVIDFGRDENARDLQALAVLGEARERDAVTLWHLLPRVGSQVRKKVYDRLAGIVRPPEGVTSDGILSLDGKMLRAWGESIPALWWMKESGGK